MVSSISVPLSRPPVPIGGERAGVCVFSKHGIFPIDPRSGPRRATAALLTILFALVARPAHCQTQTPPGNPLPREVAPVARPANPKLLTHEQEERLREAKRLNQRAIDLPWREALPLAQEAVRIRQQILGLEDKDTAQSLHVLAAQYHCKGDYARAETLYRQALEIRKKVLGLENKDTAQSLYSLAVLYYNQRNYGQAEPLYRQALEIRKKVLGENHRDYAACLVNLAGLYQAQGEYAKAEPLYRQALEIRKKSAGREPPRLRRQRA